MKNKIYVDAAGVDVIIIDGVCYKRTGGKGQSDTDATKAQPVTNIKKQCKEQG